MITYRRIDMDIFFSVIGFSVVVAIGIIIVNVAGEMIAEALSTLEGIIGLFVFLCFVGGLVFVFATV